MIDWLFRNRTTGTITVAQFPNLSLAIFLGAVAFRWVADPTGTLATVVEVVATGSLVWWALDEVIRGVNPFRRLLGATVLLAIAVGMAT